MLSDDEVMRRFAEIGERFERIRRDDALRRCKTEGHQYQVHGRLDPMKVGCKRCGATWTVQAASR